MAYQTINEYIASLDGWQAEVVSTLRHIIRQATPKATEVDVTMCQTMGTSLSVYI